MKYLRFVFPLILILIASSASAEYRFFNVSQAPGNSRECIVASSPDGIIVVAWEEANEGVWTRSISDGAFRDPVFHGEGRFPTVCWNPEGFTLAWAAGNTVLIRSGNGESWSDMEFFENISDQQVMFPHLTGYQAGLVFGDVYLSWEEHGTRIWFSRRVGGLWEPAQIVHEEEEWGIGPAQAQPKPDIVDYFPRVYYLNNWHLGLDYMERHGDLWDGPFSIYPQQPYFGADYESASGPLTQHILGMGAQPTCPRNNLYYTYELPGGDWALPEEMTIELAFYDWPMYPSLVVDAAGTVHAFWYQVYADDMMNPVGEAMYYKTRPIGQSWIDHSEIFDDRAGNYNDIALDRDGNAIFVYSEGEYSEREVWIGMEWTTTDVVSAVGDGPALAAWPNPFNPKTTISYTVPEAGPAMLAIYDVSGRRLATLAEGPRAAGEHQATWDGRDDAGNSLGSGIYLARVESAGRAQTEKLVLMK